MGDRLTTLENRITVITLSRGIRFLYRLPPTGDVYYGTSRPGQNLIGPPPS